MEFRFERGRRLNYRLASRIYEAADLGFLKEETLELDGIPARVYDYAIEHRKDIEGKINEAMQILHPE